MVCVKEKEGIVREWRKVGIFIMYSPLVCCVNWVWRNEREGRSEGREKRGEDVVGLGIRRGQGGENLGDVTWGNGRWDGGQE